MSKNIAKSALFIVNLIFLLAIVISDIFYIKMGGLILKGFTSSLFVILGLINLIYIIIKAKRGTNFHVKFASFLFAGLVFAMLGDIVLNIHFISGAILFAIGHILFFVSYLTLSRFRWKDLLYALVIFIPSLLIIVLVPIFNYGSVLMEIVCVIYALIISIMVGKAISNFVSARNVLNLIILIGSVLFYLSDFMLLFNVFSAISSLFGILCLSLYYPAEFMLAHSIIYSNQSKKI